LGNVRLSYKDISTTSTPNLEIQEENNYYPYGLKHKGYNTVQNGRNHKYGFGGKEEQNELGLGWIDITARNYNPELGRWMNLDPLAETMRRHSPYNYAFDNPVFFIDPDGMNPCPNGDCPDPPSWLAKMNNWVSDNVGKPIAEWGTKIYNKISSMDPINVEGDGEQTSEEDRITIISSIGTDDPSQDTTDAPTTIVDGDDFLNISKTAKTKSPFRKGDGMTNAIKKTKNMASEINSKVKDFKKGFSHTKKTISLGKKVAASLASINEPDTLTYEVLGYSTQDPDMRGYINEDPSGSKNMGEAVKLMLFGDEIDSVTVTKKYQ
jgi:RHS repeat-associated protein